MESSSPSPSAASASSATTNSGGGGSEQGKLFVGGIPWNTTEEILRDYFKKYGEVTEAIIMKDRGTGNARGFGFVSFSDPSSADSAIQDTTTKHVILGRTVEVKRAIPRGEQRQSCQHRYHNYSQLQNRGLSKSNSSTDGSQTRTKKIFVGGLSSNLTEDEFRSYFEKFGRITDVVVMYDSATHRPRGFGFITFDTEESVENVVQNSFHELNGKAVEVKRAVPKEGNTTTTNTLNKNNYDNTNNGSSNNSRMGNGRGSAFGNSNAGIYQPYSSPSYGIFQGYGFPLVSGYPYGAGGYSGGYAIGGYGGIGYGAPYVGLRIPCNGPGFVGVRRSPMPYGTAAVYPSYPNESFGPYLGTATGGYRGLGGSANVKWSQNGGDLQIPAVNGNSPQAEGGMVEDR